MIKAFQKQLETLSKDTQDPFTRYIRLQAGAREAVRFEEPLRHMILHMPAMVSQIREWTEDTHHPQRIRRVHNFVLAYLYNPEDFLSEKNEGLFGYLDDAYLVARAYELTLEELRYGNNPFEDIPVHADELQQWISLTRELLPHVVEQIDLVLKKLDGPALTVSYSTAKGA